MALGASAVAGESLLAEAVGLVDGLGAMGLTGAPELVLGAGVSWARRGNAARHAAKVKKER
jgi:hypothetical protein